MLARIRLDTVLWTIAAVAVLALFSPSTLAQPCEVVDNGTGTIDMPPPGCPYLSPDDVHLILEGVPAGTQLNLAPAHEKFFVRLSGPGGNLGGEIEIFDSLLRFDVTGVGPPPIGGFTKTIFLDYPAVTETHIGPRTPGAPVQDFDTEMVQLQGELFGDPDFCTLRVTAGTAHGLPSSGHTTLTRLPNGNFNVDSFFDITYQIEFEGCPGTPFHLPGGPQVTTGTVRMQAGEPAEEIPPCTVVDNGTGTVDLPPQGCSYVSPNDLHEMIDGLPAGTQLNIAPEHNRFLQVTHEPGGNLGGEVETFNSSLRLQMAGQGPGLDGFLKDVTVDIACETHTGPRTAGDDVQTFDTEMVALQGELFGDPDFCTFKVSGGSAHGLPSPGSTTLTRLPSGNFNVDSFFDITYQIEFQGCPGTQFDGLGGTTTGTVRMESGRPLTCDPIPAGQDIFPSTAKLVVEPLDGTSPPFVLRLSDAGLSPTIVERQTEDTATRSVDTEMVSLSLRGNHPNLGGEVIARAGSSFGLPPSVGRIDNVDKDPASCEFRGGDSFFDVFTEIELTSTGQVLTNQDPLHLRKRLRTLPPRNEKYENPFVEPVTLFDRDTGEAVARVLYELHHADPPFPPPGEDCFDTQLQARLDFFPLGLQNHPLNLQGPTTVRRSAPFPSFSTCCASGGTCSTDADCPPDDSCACDGPLAIETEMLSMDLHGFDPVLGEIFLQPSRDRRSVGQAQSIFPDRTYAVDSFFDVFFDITVENNQGPLHSREHLTVSNIGSSGKDGVSQLPPDPGTPFDSALGDEVVLVDGSDPPTPVGVIRDVVHTVGPPRDWQPPPPPGDDCFDSWLHLEITIDNPSCTETLWIPSVFRILRDAPQDPAGLGMFIIETLMAKGLLDIDSACVGALTGTLSPDVESKGSVSALTPAEFFPGDSFFDVHVQLDTGIGTLSAGPLHMETTVNGLPPEDGEIYYGPGTQIPLIDDSGQVIGSILELEHEVHEAVECPSECLPKVRFGGAFDEVGRGAPNPKAIIDVRIISASAGVLYDVARGDLNHLNSSGGTMTSAICLRNNLGGKFFDFDEPTVGEGFFYLARDTWKAYEGTWNLPAPSQVGDRDVKISVCSP